MAKLPHYKNSEASMGMYEPVYTNLFDIAVTPPLIMQSSWPGELMMEQVIKVGGLDIDKVPGAEITQTYKGWTRSYAASKLDNTYVDITIDFEVNINKNNSIYVYSALKEWCNLIFDPYSGEMHMKSDYAGGPMKIILYNREGVTIREYTFPVVFPTTSIPAIDLDYTSSGIYTISGFTFRADYYESQTVK